jgi:hypothetical protein
MNDAQKAVNPAIVDVAVKLEERLHHKRQHAASRDTVEAWESAANLVRSLLHTPQEAEKPQERFSDAQIVEAMAPSGVFICHSEKVVIDIIRSWLEAQEAAREQPAKGEK